MAICANGGGRSTNGRIAGLLLITVDANISVVPKNFETVGPWVQLLVTLSLYLWASLWLDWDSTFVRTPYDLGALVHRTTAQTSSQKHGVVDGICADKCRIIFNLDADDSQVMDMVCMLSNGILGMSSINWMDDQVSRGTVCDAVSNMSPQIEVAGGPININLGGNQNIFRILTSWDLLSYPGCTGHDA